MAPNPAKCKTVTFQLYSNSQEYNASFRKETLVGWSPCHEPIQNNTFAYFKRFLEISLKLIIPPQFKMGCSVI